MSPDVKTAPVAQPSVQVSNKLETITLSEYFSSIQGEGEHVGEYSTFVRFSQCNFSCYFCDSQNVMSKTKEVPISVLKNEIDNETNNIIFTGGEPTLPKYRREMMRLLDAVDKNNLYRITTETNGIFLNEWKNELDARIDLNHTMKRYSFSPKYYDEKTFEKTKLWLSNLAAINDGTITCKIVLDPQGINEFQQLCEIWLEAKSSNRHHLYIMPLGETVEKLKLVTEMALEFQEMYRCNYSPRLHIDLGLK